MLGPGEEEIYSKTWNLTDNSGDPVPPGTYQVTAEVISDLEIDPATLDIEVEVEQIVSLYEGWNFVSLYCDPETADLASVLATVWQYFNSIWTYNAEIQEWQRYVANGPPELNTLTTTEPGRGYLVNMSDDVTISFSGPSIADTEIALWPEWNLVGCNSAIPLSWDEASLPIECEYMGTYDNLTGEWPGYAPGGPPFMNTSTELYPGLAYWMYVTDSCMWDVGASIPASSAIEIARYR